MLFIRNKRGESISFIKDKRGLQLAISTLVLMVLGILVLIGLISILIMGWGDFKTQIKVILGSDMAKAQKNCELQCNLENYYDYCCETKSMNGEGYTCLELLNKDCSCEGLCQESPPLPF
jgi:hypothetical protein